MPKLIMDRRKGQAFTGILKMLRNKATANVAQPGNHQNHEDMQSRKNLELLMCFFTSLWSLKSSAEDSLTMLHYIIPRDEASLVGNVILPK